MCAQAAPGCRVPMHHARPMLAPYQIARARQLHDADAHANDIARALKCSRATIYRALNHQGAAKEKKES